MSQTAQPANLANAKRCATVRKDGKSCGMIAIKGAQWCRHHHPDTLRKKRARADQPSWKSHAIREKPETQGGVVEELSPVLPPSASQGSQGSQGSPPDQPPSHEPDLAPGGPSEVGAREYILQKKSDFRKVEVLEDVIQAKKYRIGAKGKRVQEKKASPGLFQLHDELAILQLRLEGLLKLKGADCELCGQGQKEVDAKVLDYTRLIKDLVKANHDMEKDRAKFRFSVEYVDKLLDQIVRVFMPFVPREEVDRVVLELEKIRSMGR